MFPPAGGKGFASNGSAFEATATVSHGALTLDFFSFTRLLPPPTPPPPLRLALPARTAPSAGLMFDEPPPQCWLSWCFFRS